MIFSFFSEERYKEAVPQKYVFKDGTNLNNYINFFTVVFRVKKI